MNIPKTITIIFNLRIYIKDNARTTSDLFPDLRSIRVFAAFLCASALPEPQRFQTLPYNPRNPPKVVRPTYNPKQPPKFIRVRRFVEGEHQTNPAPNGPKAGTWEVKPDLSRDDRGNTRANIDVKRQGENHDFEASYGNTIRGPSKHSETWRVGGTFRW
ncbi:rhinocerosin-like [Cylas formicarius]|uniref:rhinocerosin-like n=1 Tax=Cylas formicarius TaxID=197179 RepID=UPI002958B9A1|nr:rhinocerosin-like [Cylas formicarius]